jgi:hypothetical protein
MSQEYCRALVQLLLEEAADLIEAGNLTGQMEELMMRLEQPERHSAAGRLTRGILDTVNAKSPMSLSAGEFNRGAEKFYRETLRQRHILEAFGFLEEDCLKADQAADLDDSLRSALQAILGGKSALAFIIASKREVLEERAPLAVLKQIINLLLVTIHQDLLEARNVLA